jgi:hypothetical protein
MQSRSSSAPGSGLGHETRRATARLPAHHPAGAAGSAP